MLDSIMTNSVIRQATNLEIERRDVLSHFLRMATNVTKLPNDTRQAMEPAAIGERLRLLRLSLNLSPSEMADGLGIERTYWSRFEKGHRSVSDSVAALLCVKYRVTLDFLILGKWDQLPFEVAESLRSVQAAK